jgi:hypothetical protein
MRLVSNVVGRDENNPLLLISNLSHARMCQKEGFRSLVFAKQAKCCGFKWESVLVDSDGNSRVVMYYQENQFIGSPGTTH